jgi:hypothetical protein
MSPNRQGGGREFIEVYHFCQNCLALILHFGLFSQVLGHCIFEKNVTSHCGGAGYGAMSQNDTWGRGNLKLAQKVSNIIRMAPSNLSYIFCWWLVVFVIPTLVMICFLKFLLLFQH